VTAPAAATLACARERTAVGRLQEAVGSLRHVADVDGLAERAVAAACAGVGLDRAMLFRVDGSRLVAEAVHVARDPEGAQRLLREAREQPFPLQHAQVETEIVRRRLPRLVRVPQGDPGTGLVRFARSPAFVLAPVMPEGRVIGLLYGDRAAGGGELDALDLDLLWMLSEGVGHVLQSILLRERLEAQRAQLQRMMSAAADAMRAACTAEIALGTPASSDTVVALRPGRPPVDRLQALLTRRELEVLELVADGETNAGIADRLVIAEGTVKSHVKSLLRKLHVANRAEAVSRYHRIAAVAAEGA
jgi:DNA-binding CsgD family transcriptional regulator/GAF domain-containing protein